MPNDEEKAEQVKGPGEVEVGKPVVPTVNWDDSQMRSSYANVVNASSTREECPCAVSTTTRSTPASIRRSVRAKPSSPTVVAAATHRRPC